MARWTWGLPFWWAAHIKWQPWYLWTDGAARLNSDICFCAIADTEWSLAQAVPEVSIYPPFGASLSQSSTKSLAFIGNWCQVATRLLIIFIFSINFWDLTWTLCYCHWSHPSARPHLGPAPFCQRVSTSASAGLSYILFIALGLT